MMGLVLALERLAGRVEDLGGWAGKIGNLVVVGRPERPRTRDPRGQHWDLLSGNLAQDVVCQSSGLAGGFGRPGSAA